MMIYVYVLIAFVAGAIVQALMDRYLGDRVVSFTFRRALKIEIVHIEPSSSDVPDVVFLEAAEALAKNYPIPLEDIYRVLKYHGIEDGSDLVEIADYHGKDLTIPDI